MKNKLVRMGCVSYQQSYQQLWVVINRVIDRVGNGVLISFYMICLLLGKMFLHLQRI